MLHSLRGRKYKNFGWDKKLVLKIRYRKTTYWFQVDSDG
jgi:hypothetical protein